MNTITSRAAMQKLADTWRAQNKTIALVPTMGALHAGHLALVKRAQAESDIVVVSIFVNPTQFAPGEDYEQYPRSFEQDQKHLQSYRVAAIFLPDPKEMYPYGLDEVKTTVRVEGLSDNLCGAYREGHFEGVTTIVTKLFLACKPHTAIFGLKDAQQFFVLKRMVNELGFDVNLIGIPTVRDQNGLAKSSRNAYLSDADRAKASVIAKTLKQTKQAILAGELDINPLVRRLAQRIIQAGGNLQYAEAVDTHMLAPIATAQPGQELLIAVAAFFGTTRLIDNLIVTVPQHVQHD